MIVDNIRNRNLYASRAVLLAEAMEFVAHASREGGEPFQERTVSLPGTEAYAIFQQYRTTATGERVLESHRRFVDLQFVLEGGETIRVCEAEGLPVTKPYDDEKDVAFYQFTNGIDLHLRAGDFVVLFPHEAHAPKLPLGGPGEVKKIVVKVPVSVFEA